MRIDQWLKNLLIFVPFFSYGNFDLAQGLDLVRVFFGFSLIVSSTYILNDLVDLSSDREHPSKKLRPVASGVYKTNVWVAILSICLLLGKVILFLTNVQTLIYSTLYLTVTIIYTFKLKYIFRHFNSNFPLYIKSSSRRDSVFDQAFCAVDSFCSIYKPGDSKW